MSKSKLETIATFAIIAIAYVGLCHLSACVQFNNKKLKAIEQVNDLHITLANLARQGNVNPDDQVFRIAATTCKDFLSNPTYYKYLKSIDKYSTFVNLYNASI